MSAKGKKKPVKLGIVGAGLMSQVAHISNYAMLDNCQLVALAELKPRLRSLVAERYKIRRTYFSHKELLLDPQVEAVIVIVPRPLIGPIAFDCLTAGKHLFTEKPMAATVAQAEKLVKLSQKKKVCYAVGYMRRHDEGVQKAKKIIDRFIQTGELGPIIYARAHCFMGNGYCNIDGYFKTDEKIPEDRPAWPIAPDWIPPERKKDYAWFLNVYCHNINLLRFLLDVRPKVEYVRLDRKDGRIILLDFGQYSCIVEAGNLTHHSWDEFTEIYFAHGYLRIDTPPALLRNMPARIEVYKATKKQQSCQPKVNWSWAFKRQAESFIQSVKENSLALASGKDALEDMRLIEEIWRIELSRKNRAKFA